MGYWKFDDGSGTSAVDSSGNGHAAMLVNGISWVPGQVNDAVSANAAHSQYVRIPAIDLSGTKAVTVAFWTNRTYTSATHTLLENSANFNLSTTGFGIFPDDSADCGLPGTMMTGVQGNLGYTLNCYSQPSSGDWHHIAAVFDKSRPGPNVISFYIDGVLQTPRVQLDTVTNTNNFGFNLMYVFSRSGTQEFSAGVVDDLRLYNVALTASQIQEIYNWGACKLLASPSSISFPATTIGYSDSLPASLVSQCKRTIHISSININGSAFSVSGISVPVSIAAGHTASYTATFTPTTVGTTKGSVTFHSDANDVALAVSLAGLGVTSLAGQLRASPARLNFGNVTVQTTVTQAVQITNTGGASVTVSAVRASGAGFSVASISTPFTLKPGASKQLHVSFAPTSIGAATGTLTATSTAQNGTLTVPLTGNGVSHFVSLTWTASTSMIVGYNVYRSTSSSGPFNILNGGLISGTSYTDQAVQRGTTYYYVAKSVNAQGIESVYSNEVSATVP